MPDLFFLIRIAWSDWKTMQIRNLHVGALFLIACVYCLQVLRQPVTEKIIGTLIISMPMLILTIIKPGSFGGGDIKLLAVSGFLLGKDKILQTFWIALLCAAIYAIYLILIGKSRKEKFPLGTFLCMGILGKFLEVF